MKVYDLVRDFGEPPYSLGAPRSLGIFASLADVLRTIDARDGVDGKPVSAEAGDAETLAVYERIVGGFCGQGSIGTRVATIERVKKYPGRGDIWESEIIILEKEDK